MEINIDTEKTVEQIGMQMWEIVGRLAVRCAGAVAINTAKNAESLLRIQAIQKDFLRYDKLIALIESVKQPDEGTAKHKAAFFEAASVESASKLFERLIDLLVKTKNAGEMLAAFHEYVPVLVHRMRVEGMIKEGGENG